MTSYSDLPQVPQNRPFLSVPGKAITAALWFYLFWGWTVPTTAGSLTSLFGDYALAGVLLVLAVSASPVLTNILSLRYGSLRGIKLMWLFAYTGVGLTLFNGVTSLLLIAGLLGGAGDVSTGEFRLLATAASGVLGFFLFRAMRSVRWLDPKSLPAEWERKMAVGRGTRR